METTAGIILQDTQMQMHISRGICFINKYVKTLLYRLWQFSNFGPSSWSSQTIHPRVLLTGQHPHAYDPTHHAGKSSSGEVLQAVWPLKPRCGCFSLVIDVTRPRFLPSTFFLVILGYTHFSFLKRTNLSLALATWWRCSLFFQNVHSECSDCALTPPLRLFLRFPRAQQYMTKRINH